MTKDRWSGDLAAMRLDGYPMTREGYLDWAYLGSPPGYVEEDTLPPQFRHGYADDGRESGRRRHEPDGT
jgi:hypothetical protein